MGGIYKMKIHFCLSSIITSVLFTLPVTSFAGGEHMRAEFNLEAVHREPHVDHRGSKRRNLPPGYPVRGPNGVDESDTWNQHKGHEEPTGRERLRDKS